MKTNNCKENKNYSIEIEEAAERLAYILIAQIDFEKNKKGQRIKKRNLLINKKIRNL